MERPIIKNRDELKKICQPIVDYLQKNCNPYIEVHISMDEIRVTSVECGIPISERADNQN